jgi:mannose-6-phosphate isomerase-like protein (cupin superfamily)
VSPSPRPSAAVIRLGEAQRAIPGPSGAHAVSVLQHGTLDVKLALGRFAPRPPGEETSHTQDEVYVVVRGRGVLRHEGRGERFEAGDLLFVAAGTDHRFEDFTEDLAVWAVFYGPPGGDVPA